MIEDKINQARRGTACGPQLKNDMKQQASRNNRLKGKQSFSFTAPGASCVQLAGDFTQWEQRPVDLQKGADGVWRTILELAPGAYHYRFLVDGQWRDDPECALLVPNPYGSQDAVREVA